MTQVEERLTVTRRQAAALTGFSESALRKWEREGRGPRVLKISRSVRYLLSDLRAWLISHSVSDSECADPSPNRSRP
jgi:predicted DNA-binding transcriptional regulator AlpA